MAMLNLSRRLHDALQDVPLAVTGVSIGDPANKATWLVSPSALQGAAQAIINAFDTSQAAQTAWENLMARASAQAAIDARTDDLLKLLRAEAAVLVDEINALRQWVTSFKAAVAASSTLADMKTRVAALNNLPDRTLAQAKTAIKAAIAAGTVD